MSSIATASATYTVGVLSERRIAQPDSLPKQRNWKQTAFILSRGAAVGAVLGGSLGATLTLFIAPPLLPIVAATGSIAGGLLGLAIVAEHKAPWQEKASAHRLTQSHPDETGRPESQVNSAPGLPLPNQLQIDDNCSVEEAAPPLENSLGIEEDVDDKVEEKATILLSIDGGDINKLKKSCLRDDKNFMLEACSKRNGMALQYASLHLLINQNLFLEVVSKNGLSYFYGPSREFMQHLPNINNNIISIARSNLPASPQGQNSTAPRRVFFTPIPSLHQTIERYHCREKFLFINRIFSSCFNRLPSSYPRDSAVLTLKNKKWLIPYFTLENEIPLTRRLAQMIFAASKRCLYDTGIGGGWQACELWHLMIHAQEQNVAYIQGTTRMEGGNVIPFIDKHGAGAIVGEESLYTSIIALEQQGVFTNSCDIDEIEPSDDLIRISRHLHLRSNHSKSWDEPVSAEDRIQYRKEAQILHRKREITKARMAEELEIAPDRLILIPQKFFHIDMELFFYEGTVYLNDAGMVLDTLNRIKERHVLNSETQKLCDEYFEEAQLQKERFSQIQSKCIEVLQEQGLRVELLPAVMTSKASKSALNLCNGIVIQKENLTTSDGETKENESYFLTNGPSDPFEQEILNEVVKIIQEKQPKLKLVLTPMEPRLLFETHGGVRCRSNETKHPWDDPQSTHQEKKSVELLENETSSNPNKTNNLLNVVNHGLLGIATGDKMVRKLAAYPHLSLSLFDAASASFILVGSANLSADAVMKLFEGEYRGWAPQLLPRNHEQEDWPIGLRGI